MNAVDPINDPARLAAVLASGLLDTAAEAPFDDLTRLAATLIVAPFAFATLVDDKRSFWKSTFGLPEGAPRQNTVEQSFCQYVVRSRTALVVTDATSNHLTKDNPSVEAMGVRAWAGFPLLAPDGEVLGSFCVVDTQTREWTERDLEVLRTLSFAASREIALRAAVANEREARMRSEALAETLQASMLPPVLPNVPGLDVAAHFRAAGSGTELVGDFYDLFEIRDKQWAFVIGDVCGKGVEAAKVALLARHTISAAALQRSEPAGVMELLNDTFLARRGGSTIFLTAIYGTLTLDATGCTARWARAGHLPPIVRRADGTVEPVGAGGRLIGVMPSLNINEAGVRLVPGDSLIVYTDGVSEARNASGQFGDQAVYELVASADPNATATQLAERIERAALDFTGGIAQDDIAVLVLRFPSQAL